MTSQTTDVNSDGEHLEFEGRDPVTRRSRSLVCLALCSSLAAALPVPTAWAGDAPVKSKPDPGAGDSSESPLQGDEAGQSTDDAATATPPSESTPDAEDPNSLTDQAVARFQAKDYEGAVELFERAYENDRNPNYLFNIGRVYEESGDLDKSVEYYGRFVNEPGVDLESREIALKRLRVLKEILSQTAAAKEPDKPPEPAEGPQEGDTPPVDDGKRKLSGAEIAGYSVMGLGGAAMIVGGVFGGLALSQQSKLDTQMSLENRQEVIKSGETNALAADILIISGGVLVATGLIVALVGRRNARAKSKAVARFSPGRELGLVYHF